MRVRRRLAPHLVFLPARFPQVARLLPRSGASWASLAAAAAAEAVEAAEEAAADAAAAA